MNQNKSKFFAIFIRNASKLLKFEPKNYRKSFRFGPKFRLKQTKIRNFGLWVGKVWSIYITIMKRLLK